MQGDPPYRAEDQIRKEMPLGELGKNVSGAEQQFAALPVVRGAGAALCSRVLRGRASRSIHLLLYFCAPISTPLCQLPGIDNIKNKALG